MDRAELLAVIAKYPSLADLLPDHATEVFRLAERIVRMENEPDLIPLLPASAPQWEHAYWARRAARRKA